MSLEIDNVEIIQTHSDDDQVQLDPAQRATSSGDDHRGLDRLRRRVRFIVYSRRWYILFLFSLMACLQATVWNTFGPISKAVIFSYGWSDTTVAMMANWGPIMFVIGALPMSWICDKYGLRKVTLTASAFVTSGACLRMLSRNENAFTYLCHMGSILNGIAGVTVMSVPAAISAVWFPPNERTTATSINQVANNLGNAVAFLVGPVLVPDGDIPRFTGVVTNATLSTKMDIRYDLQSYLIGQAAVAAIILFAVMAFFPARPPSAPSASSTAERVHYKESLIQLAKSKNIWLCTMIYAIPCGFNGGFLSVLSINFAPLGIDDLESGYIGMLATSVPCLTTILISLFMDRFKRNMKRTLVALAFASGLAYSWLLLICLRLLPFSRWQLYASTVAGASLNYASIPLIFEYTSESAYPNPENVVGIFLTTFNNFFGFIFLCVFFIPMESVIWMNYCLVISAFGIIPLILMTSGEYNRLAVDEQYDEDEDRSVNEQTPLLGNPVQNNA